jgi:5-(carboxyamino)imidazole ribonucleotide mutase
MLVPIIMGSKSDLEVGKRVQKALLGFEIKSTIRVASAHKSPHHLLKMLTEYTEQGVPLYITIAGRSNALSGMVDAAVVVPVIACPPYSNSFGGADVFSSMRMPSGVSPALVLEPENAALLAAKILAPNAPEVAFQVDTWKKIWKKQIRVADLELLEGGYICNEKDPIDED